MKNKLILGILTLMLATPTFSLIVQDPTIKNPRNSKEVSNTNETTFDIIPPYNAFSITVPSSELLAKVSSKRVMDMAATAYSHNFLTKSLYFYTNVIALFPKDTVAVAWANYEAGYIHFHRKQYEKAVKYFDAVLELRGTPTTVQNLSKQMAGRIRNEKEYKTLRKQEDVVFIADKKARALLDKQIAKEEREAEKLQRALSKERKKREKEEKRLLKEAEKAEKKRLKEEEKRLKEEAKAKNQ